MTTKIVYNASYGGFGLSEEGVVLYKKLSGQKKVDPYDFVRHCPFLVEVVETLGQHAGDWGSQPKITTIKGDKYYIKEYDGYETIIEPDDIQWIHVD